MLFYFSFIIKGGIQGNFLSKMWTIEVDHLIFVLNQHLRFCVRQSTLSDQISYCHSNKTQDKSILFII